MSNSQRRDAFLKSLATPPRIESKEKYDYFREMNNKFNDISNDPIKRKYVDMMILALHYSLSDAYPLSAINISYRYKSPSGIASKINEKFQTSYVSFDENQKFNIQSKPIYDAVALKIIVQPAVSINYSSDPSITELIKKSEQDRAFIGEMLEFRSKDHNIFNQNSTYPKEELIANSKRILNWLINSCHPEETNLINYYKNQLLKLDSDTMSILDLKSNLNVLINTLQDKAPNELFLAHLTKKTTDRFSSDFLKSLGISLNTNIPIKEKITPNGYRSNFIYLDTLLGTIECQLQTYEQYRFGNIGFAAHGKMPGKEVKLLPIPNPGAPLSAYRVFEQKVKNSSPNYCECRLDDSSFNLNIRHFSDIHNYITLLQQINGSSKELDTYIKYLIKQHEENNLLPKRGSNISYSIDDVIEYSRSEEFQNLHKNLTGQSLNSPNECR